MINNQTKFNPACHPELVSGSGFKQIEVGPIPKNWEVLKFGDIAKLGKEKYIPAPNMQSSHIKNTDFSKEL